MNVPLKTVEAAILGSIIIMSSVFRGGNRNIAMAMLLLLALVLFSLILANWLSSRRTLIGLEFRQFGQSHRSPVWRSAMIALLAASPLYITLTQINPELFLLLSRGTSGGLDAKLYVDHFTGLEIGFRTLSSVPDATFTSAMCGFIIATVFLAALTIGPNQLATIIFVWMAVAIIQIAVICFQLAGGSESWAYFNSDFRHVRAYIGTFNSRNTLAGYFAAGFPLFVWYFFHCRRNSWNSQAVRALAFATSLTVLTGVLLLVFGLQSRGGLLSFIFSTAFTLLVVGAFHIKRSSLRIAALQITIGVFVLFVASLLVGWDTVSERFSLQDSFRHRLFVSAWQGALDLLPFGSGLGSFGYVYPIYQPLDLAGYISLAHNDYIQLLFELGYLSVVLVGAVVALLLASLRSLYRELDADSELGDSRTLKLFALPSLAALSFHSTVEFNMHIPVMAILFAFVFGLIVREPAKLPSQ